MHNFIITQLQSDLDKTYLCETNAGEKFISTHNMKSLIRAELYYYKCENFESKLDFKLIPMKFIYNINCYQSYRR